ncbi:hypothetical protein [Pseudomonas baetica]|uniref:hypothetical protein n=1 Tax=Pseudomonas baetica TaxID=674054 RepID=UPI0028728E15|nr:hypothetical protein [Pseudomonas baetica]MDR9865724.1 hypothetical protein [Pseudomonas baetica]
MGKKQPVKGADTVDTHTRAGQPDDPIVARPDSPPRLDPLPLEPRLPDSANDAIATQASGLDTPTPAVAVNDVASSSIARPLPRQRPLRYYRIPDSINLPDADAQGFRVFQGRPFVKVAGGYVQVGIDSETSLYRACLASEATPTGPVLVRDHQSQLWRALEESAVNVYRSAVDEDAEARKPNEQDMEPDHSDDEFELASESMPIAPFTPQELAFMREAASHSFLDNQLGSYNRANNGRYPFRDSRGRPVRIRKIETRVITPEGEQYLAAAIKPYIKFEGHEDVARLYEEKLEVRRFTHADAKVPQEVALVGQYLVAANKRLAKGEALGVYGGTIIPLKYVRRQEQTFTMYAGATIRYGAGQLIQERLVIVGDNALSRINSNFEYDATGRPVRQSPTGYNVGSVAFNVEAELIVGDKLILKPYVLTALFALQDIPAGAELRMDYDYSENEMSWVFL